MPLDPTVEEDVWLIEFLGRYYDACTDMPPEVRDEADSDAYDRWRARRRDRNEQLEASFLRWSRAEGKRLFDAAMTSLMARCTELGPPPEAVGTPERADKSGPTVGERDVEFRDALAVVRKRRLELVK